MGSSSEQYCLRWNDFQCNIADAFAELREDEELLDVTLVSEGQALRAHRLVLSACSPLFREMLHHRIPPASHSQPLVFLHGVRFRDAAAILDFMYRGEVNVNQEDLQTFLAAAEELRVRGLSDRGGGGQEQQQQQQHRQSANTRASSTSPPPSSSQRPGGPVKRPAAAAAHSNPDAKRRMDYPDERFQDEAFAGDSFDDSSSPYGQQHLGGGGGGFRGGSAFFKEEEDANGSMTGEHHLSASNQPPSPSSYNWPPTLPPSRSSGGGSSSDYFSSSQPPSSDGAPGRSVCPYCYKELKNSHSLSVHVSRYHSEGAAGNTEVVCPVCERTYCNKYSLRTHMHLNHKDQLHLLPGNRRGAGAGAAGGNSRRSAPAAATAAGSAGRESGAAAL